MSKYSEEKSQFDEMLIKIATGAVSPTELNANLQALRKTGSFIFETLETLEKDKSGLETLLDTEKTNHNTLKEKYHQEWEKSGGDDDHEVETIKTETRLSNDDMIKKLESLSQGDNEVK